MQRGCHQCRRHQTLFSDKEDMGELSPDDNWLEQYKQLAENTLISDHSTMSGQGIAASPSPEEQKRIMNANLEELMSVSKKLNINVTSSSMQPQSIDSIDHYLPSPSSMELLEDGIQGDRNKGEEEEEEEEEGGTSVNFNTEMDNNKDLISQYVESIVETAHESESSGNSLNTSDVNISIMKGMDSSLQEPADLARVRFLQAIENFEGPRSGSGRDICPKCSGPIGSEELKNWGKCSLCRQNELSTIGSHMNRQYQSSSSPSALSSSSSSPSSSSSYKVSNEILQQKENSYAADPQQYASPADQYQSSSSSSSFPRNNKFESRQQSSSVQQSTMRPLSSSSSSTRPPSSKQVMNRNINGEAKIINGKQRSRSSLLKFHREFNDDDDYHQDEEKRYLDYMMMDDQELSLEALAYRLTHQDREIERLKIFQGRAVDVEHRLDRVISALEKAEDKINDLHFELSRANKNVELLELELDKKANKKTVSKGKKTLIDTASSTLAFEDNDNGQQLNTNINTNEDIAKAFTQSPQYKRKRNRNTSP